MSSYAETYIGVYLVVDQFLEEERTKRLCENDHPQRRVSHEREPQFCSTCGSRFRTVEYTVTKRLSADEAAEEFDFDEDEFINVDRGDNPCVWIGNGDGRVDTDDCDEYEINPQTIEVAVSEFKEGHAETLALLDKNDVDYVMYYGAVFYYS